MYPDGDLGHCREIWLGQEVTLKGSHDRELRMAQMALTRICWCSRIGQGSRCMHLGGCCKGAPSPCHPSPASARLAPALQVLQAHRNKRGTTTALTKVG